MSTSTWLLRLEGVNFGTILDDTEDLSTVRGSSLALLEAAEQVAKRLAANPALGCTTLFTGASLAAFTLCCDETLAEAAVGDIQAFLRQPQPPGGPPFEYLMFIASLVPVPAGATALALDHAEAQAKASQMRGLTVQPPDSNAHSPGPDPFDHVRQAGKRTLRKGDVERAVSDSVRNRHDYGRTQRDNFYLRADARPLPVCGNFQDIAAEQLPPGLPVAAQNKLAFLYADGNGFRKIAGTVGVAEFAAELKVHQTRLLRRITAWCREGLATHDLARVSIVDGEERARFETLLWGGDEFLLVMPAWLGLHVLGEIAAETEDWEIKGHPLTHAFGLVICSAKTPVRQARQTVHDLSESVKEALSTKPAPCNAASIQVFESQSPVDAPLPVLRGRLFGVSGTAAQGLDAALTIDGAALPGLARKIRELTDDSVRHGSFPPGLLHAAIAAAWEAPGTLLGPDAQNAAQQVLEKALTRFDHQLPDYTIPGLTPRQRVLDLCLLEMLRDYARLDLAPFPAGTP